MLTDTGIRNAKQRAKPYKLADGHGLYLEVRPTGAKLWRYRYRIAGKENLFALGEYPTLRLADARDERAAARELVKQGIHPSRQRRSERLVRHAENSNTFEAVAREWMASRGATWSASYAKKVNSFLANNLFPHIGNLPLRSVTGAHLLKIIRLVEDRDAKSVALLLRQWCSAIFRYGVSTLRADTDPAAALKGAIQRPRTKHARPLSPSEISDLATALQNYGGEPTTVIALRLLLLTFVRTKELREAPWAEFNLEGAEWRIPGPRMKMKEPHIVPLSRQAVKLLRELHGHTGEGKFLFPNRRNPSTFMSATTLNRALERMGFNGGQSIGFSSHGFRATASTILNEKGIFLSDAIERQLAHAERNKSRASYNQAEHLEERRKIMNRWANMVDDFATHKNARQKNRVNKK